MKHRQSAVLATLDAVRDLITTEPALAGLTTSSAMQTLTDTIAEFSTSSNVQDSSGIKSRGQTSKSKAAVKALRNKMQGVAAVAKLRLKHTPEFSSLVMPPVDVSRPQLLARAQAMIDAATPHQDVFTATALPATFLTDLATAATAVRDTLTTRDTAKGKRSNATASLGQLTKDAVNLIQALDSLVQPLIVGNAGLEAQWTNTKRIPQKPGAAKSATPATPATTSTATPATTPVAASAATPAAAPAETHPTVAPTTAAEQPQEVKQPA